MPESHQAKPGPFDVSDVIERSRALISGSKRHGVYLLLTMVGVFLAISLVSNILFAVDPDTLRAGPLWWDVATGAFGASFLAMLTTSFGLHRARGSRLSYSTLFVFIEKLWPYLVIAVPTTLLTVLADDSGSWFVRVGVGLVIFPVTYVPYFMIDRDMSPLVALEGAYALVLANIGQFILFTLLSVGLSILGVLTLGVGLIWLGPFFMIAQAIIYDEAVGIRGDYAT
ncbi:MAG: hypothetical protein WDA03_08965 [Trueperaceae bacterium]